MVSPLYKALSQWLISLQGKRKKTTRSIKQKKKVDGHYCSVRVILLSAPTERRPSDDFCLSLL